MKLVDSHCHLDCLDLSNDDDNLAPVLERANSLGVEHFLCVCITQNDFEKMRDKVKNFPNVYLSIGTHPNEVVTHEPTVEEMIGLAQLPGVIAIGETGLDYFRTAENTEWQLTRFRNHIQVAKETKKPLIVHSRAAREDTLRIIREEQASDIGGVLHCFTENWEMAKQAIDLNFYISFSGIITFQNAKELCDVVKQVPLDRLLIETDSPYLAPVPFRGKSNEPGYVRYVAEKIAEIKNESLETIAAITSANFFKLFAEAHQQ
ncbi:MAG: TatD family hydrolase [Gammaproteobacteria bacterium]|nr:TatD family hydrolase [Gammaproteobacteria bacterium]